MFRNRLFIIAFTMVVSVSCWANSASEQLVNLLQNLSSMQANFVQKVTAEGADNALITKGTMALLRPGRFRWQITQPNQQLIVADGNYVWIYDRDLEQVTKKRLDLNQPNSPAQLLSGSVATLAKQYIITKPAAWFVLQPKQQGALMQKIELRFVGKQLQQLLMIDNLGQKSLITFSAIKMNQVLPAKLFHFTAPTGTDVVAE